MICLFALLVLGTRQQESFERPGLEASMEGLYLSGEKLAVISTERKILLQSANQFVTASALSQGSDQSYASRAIANKYFIDREELSTRHHTVEVFDPNPRDTRTQGWIRLLLGPRNGKGLISGFSATLLDPNEHVVETSHYLRWGNLSDIAIDGRYRDEQSHLTMNILEKPTSETRATITGEVTWDGNRYVLEAERILNRGWWRALNRTSNQVEAHGTFFWSPTPAAIPKEGEAWKSTDRIHVWADPQAFHVNTIVSLDLNRRIGF